MIKPKNGNVIIKLIPETKESLLKGTPNGRHSGIVISEGSDLAKKGDKVFFDERMLNEITIEGEKVFYVHEDNVIAVIY